MKYNKNKHNENMKMIMEMGLFIENKLLSKCFHRDSFTYSIWGVFKYMRKLSSQTVNSISEDISLALLKKKIMTLKQTQNKLL